MLPVHQSEGGSVLPPVRKLRVNWEALYLYLFIFDQSLRHRQHKKMAVATIMSPTGSNCEFAHSVSISWIILLSDIENDGEKKYKMYYIFYSQWPKINSKVFTEVKPESSFTLYTSTGLTVFLQPQVSPHPLLAIKVNAGSQHFCTDFTFQNWKPRPCFMQLTVSLLKYSNSCLVSIICNPPPPSVSELKI